MTTYFAFNGRPIDHSHVAALIAFFEFDSDNYEIDYPELFAAMHTIIDELLEMDIDWSEIRRDVSSIEAFCAQLRRLADKIETG